MFILLYHNVESLKKLCGEIEQDTGLTFDVRAELDLGPNILDGKQLWDDKGSRCLTLEVERLEDKVLDVHYLISYKNSYHSVYVPADMRYH